MGNIVKGRRVDDIDTADARPGDFEIYPPDADNKGMIMFVCPRGRTCGVQIRSGGFKDGLPKRWGFDGNCDRPTLTPSINCQGPAGCGWHGFLQNGEFREC